MKYVLYLDKWQNGFLYWGMTEIAIDWSQNFRFENV